MEEIVRNRPAERVDAEALPALSEGAQPSPQPDAPYPPISAYGIIGDSRSAALVSRDGSIDWLCWPRFDSPSIFGRLLDWSQGGYFSIRPVGSSRSTREYAGRTNVLATTFEAEGGRVRLLDLMPALTEAQKRARLTPYRQLLRRVEGIEGSVEMEMVCAPRPDYGRAKPKLKDRGAYGACADWGQEMLCLRSDAEMVCTEGRVVSRFRIGPRERRYFALAYTQDLPAVFPGIGEGAEEEIRMTLDFWEAWSSQMSYRGPYRDQVLRSALALKLLTFAPSGAIIAAPTTSLPEGIGGVRNWDYRFCWLRDASFTVRALHDLGFEAEADAYSNWLLHATRLTHPRVQVLYDVYGEARLPERLLTHLDGYRGSRPVRAGNGAWDQSQLDVYGEVLGAIQRLHHEGRRLSRGSAGFLTGLADFVASHWQHPDHGIWEARSGKFQHVHGKVFAWRALDAAAKVAREEGIRADIGRWERTAAEIHKTVLREGYNEGMGSLVSLLGGDQVDASLLTLPMVGFIAGNDPRMLGTIRRIQQELGRGELLYRYRGVDDGLPGDEGAFLTCSFWLVSALALAGKIEEADAVFQRLLGRASDLGLYSEEIDPDTGAFLGNFPQGLTHLALINAAVTLAEQQEAPQGSE